MEDTAVIVDAGDVAGLRAALDRVVLEMSEHDKRALEWREHALAFDRARVFDDLFAPSMELRTATVTPLRQAEESVQTAANAR